MIYGDFYWQFPFNVAANPVIPLILLEFLAEFSRN